MGRGRGGEGEGGEGERGGEGRGVGRGAGRAGLIFTCVLGAAPENQFLHLEMLLATEPAGRGQSGWAVPCNVRQDAASN